MGRDGNVFKAVVLEGIEVVFIVIAVGAGGRGLVVPAAIGAAAACVIVGLAGLIIHKPLARVPENTLKFCVGIMLSAFGVFWVGEGLGVSWPGHDLAILAFAAIFLAVGLSMVKWARSVGQGGPAVTILSTILRELLGLFIDDEFLAAATFAVIALATVLALLFEAPQLIVGATLVVGCIAVLMLSVIRGARKA